MDVTGLVLLEVSQLGETFLARGDRAGEGFPAAVDFFMLRQGRRAGEVLVANDATVQLFFCVRNEVFLQVGRTEELFAAELAVELLRRLVFVNDSVLSQIPSRCEPEAAHVADESPILCVRQHVVLETRLVNKVLVTHSALEISDVEVDPLVG